MDNGRTSATSLNQQDLNVFNLSQIASALKERKKEKRKEIRAVAVARSKPIK